MSHTLLSSLCLCASVVISAVSQLVPAQLDRSDPIVYEKEIHPIFKTRCMVCHTGPTKESGFDISTYEGLIKGGKRGSPIVPGKSQDSLLFKLCNRTQKPFMPPKDEPQLTPMELALIKLWIDQGAKAPTNAIATAKIVAGLPAANVTPVRAVAVSPDKALIMMGRGNQIHVFDGAKGDYLRSFTEPGLKAADKKAVQAAHLALVESMALSPDGKYLASGSFQEVSLWDVKTGKLEKKLTGFEHCVVALAFSADGKRLATGGGLPTANGEVKVFEVGSWKVVADIKNGHSDTVFGVSFSPDGGKLAACGADKFVKIFEVPNGKLLKSLEGHTHHVMDVGWKFDGKLLASAGSDSTIKIWNYETGEQTKSVQGQTKQVTRLQFIGKTNMFATCSVDGLVKFWNADNGSLARNFPAGRDYFYSVSVSPDSQLVAAGGEEGIVYVYNGANGQLVRTLKSPDEKK